MKNINVTTEFFDMDLSEYSGATQLGKVAESVKANKREDQKYYIDELTIATWMCAMSSKEDTDLTKKYRVRWTLGTIKQGEEDEFDYYVVSDSEFYPLKTRKEKNSPAICRHFSNQIFKFTLRDYEVTKAGDYYLKVFLREEGENTWILQSMNSIVVEF